MNISPMHSCNFGQFGYYGKQGPVLEEVYPGYSGKMKDNDTVCISKKDGMARYTTAGNVRTLAIQEKHPRYRYVFSDDDVVDTYIVDGAVRKVTAGEIRKDFALEEENARKEGRVPRIIDFNI